MKHLIIFILLFSAISFTYSQNVFQKEIGSVLYSEYAYNTIELSDGSFFLVSRRDNVGSFSNSSPYVIHIDENGILVNENFIEDTTRFFVYNSILEFNSKLVAIGTLPAIGNFHGDSIIISELDSNLNVVSNFKLFLDNHPMKSLIYGQVFSDTLLLISGYMSKYSDKYHRNSFAILLDTSYNIISRNIISIDSNSSTEFYNYVYVDSLFKSYGLRHKLSLNLNMSIDTVINTQITLNQPIYLNKFADKVFMTSRIGSGSVNFYELDNQLDTVKSVRISKDSAFSYPAVVRGLSSKDNYMFYGFTYKINPYTWWSDTNSLIYYAKIDTLGNILWSNYYEKNGYYYILHDVLATQDGGCILSGSSYCYNSQSFQNDIFVLKIDSNGNTTWIKNITMPNQSINIFPNPATTVVNINLKNSNQQIAHISIFDMQGKLVLHKQINAKQAKLDVSKIAKGLYVVDGETSEGFKFAGKLVKE